MMMIPVSVRPSGIHGCGVFTNERIPKKTVIWQYTPGMDRTMSPNQVDFAEPRVRDWIKTRGYVNPKRPKLWVVVCDEAQFLNFPKRGEPANTMMGGEQDGEFLILAAEDIQQGSEITVPPESDADYDRKMKESGR